MLAGDFFTEHQVERIMKRFDRGSTQKLDRKKCRWDEGTL